MTPILFLIYGWHFRLPTTGVFRLPKMSLFKRSEKDIKHSLMCLWNQSIKLIGASNPTGSWTRAVEILVYLYRMFFLNLLGESYPGRTPPDNCDQKKKNYCTKKTSWCFRHANRRVWLYQRTSTRISSHAYCVLGRIGRHSTSSRQWCDLSLAKNNKSYRTDDCG